MLLFSPNVNQHGKPRHEPNTKCENVLDRESSCELSIAREIPENPDEAATNTDDAFAALAESAGMQVFFRDTLKDQTTRIYFTLTK